METKDKIDVLIVTAADGEDEAVKEIFGTDWLPMNPIPQVGLIWDKITLISKKGRRFTVGLVRSDMGTESAGTIASIMIQYLRPSFVTMCGICAGHPDDTKFGDVIIADEVFRYDSKSTKRLDDGAVDEKFNISTHQIATPWWQLAKQRLKINGVKIHIGPIATGEPLQRDPTVWDTIRKSKRKCIGLDMEASVIGRIAHVVEKRWVVIKGVSDHATPKKNDRHHVLAKENAAKVLKEFLENVADQLPSLDNIDGIWAPPAILNENQMNFMNNAPSTMLHAKYEHVPFSDVIRHPEIEALEALCRFDSCGIIQLFIGPGGIGKTRLMIEWIKHLKIDNIWQTCFLTQDINPNSQDFKDIFLQDNNFFFVIDYAECRTNLSTILRILIAAATQKPNRMIRVVLVARHKDIWWKELSSNNLDISNYLHEHVVELRSVSIQDNMRQHLFDNAFQSFSKKINNFPIEETKRKIYTMLTEPIFGRILYIHMAAYATVVGLNFTAQTLLDVIVSYEKHFWTIQFREKINGDQAKTKFIQETSRVLTALTLFGGVDSYDKLTSLINISKGPDDDLFPKFLRSFYPPAYSTKIIGCLEPDLLGEYLVFDTLCYLRTQKVPFNDAIFLTNTFNLTDDSNELQQAFTVLGRIAEHEICKNEKTMIEEWLSLPFDERHLGIRSIPAVGAAISLAEKTAFCPIPDILTIAFEKYGSMLLASKIWKILPDDSVAFRKLQLWVSETILSDFKNKEILTEEQQVSYAKALLSYGKAMSYLGQRKEALEATRESVEIRRQLAACHPDAFLPFLAMGLNNLGTMLRDLGQHEDALGATRDAVEKIRTLININPNFFLPLLAMSLNNLGTMLRDIGKREDALEVTREAVEIRRHMAKSSPDAFLPELAKNLNNLGVQYSELGKRKEALEVTREAVDKYRLLAESRPDAFLPDLAGSLNTLGLMLRDLGHYEEAFEIANESVGKYRLLAASYPDAFFPVLAGSLNNLGIAFRNLGQRENALEATQESVDKYQLLAMSYPDAFIPNLIDSLGNLGLMLKDLGRREEALEVTQKAMEKYRSFAASYPDVYLPDLAWSLNSLGTMLSDNGRHEEALEAAQESVQIRRRLAESHPDVFLPVLAGSLNNLGIRLGESGRRKEALEVAREVVDKYRILATSNPDAFLSDLAKSLNNLGLMFKNLI